MASAADSVQSTLTLAKISIDAGVTKKSLVCLTAFNFTGSTPTTDEDSWCGKHVGLGSNSFEWTGDIIVNTNPGASTEVSYADLLSIWNNQTLAIIYDQYPSDGSEWYQSASGYITNITKTQSAGQLVKATITFKGVGTLDITA